LTVCTDTSSFRLLFGQAVLALVRLLAGVTELFVGVVLLVVLAVANAIAAGSVDVASPSERSLRLAVQGRSRDAPEARMPAERRLLPIAGRLQVKIGVDRVEDGDRPL
jgi:hypothetical protein